MIKLFIIGSGRHASEVLAYVNEQNIFQFGGFVVDDSYATTIAENVFGISKFLQNNQPNNCKIIGGLSSLNRKKIIEKLEQEGYEFVNLIHQTAYVNNNTNIGLGNCIAPMTVINVNVSIGNHSIINSHVNISHDSVIGNFVTISPSVTLTGGVILADGVFVGAGATILPNVKIGKNAIVGASACVIKDVPENTTVVGIPAKIIVANNVRR